MAVLLSLSSCFAGLCSPTLCYLHLLQHTSSLERTLSDTSRSWPTHQNEETGRLMCSQVGWIPLSFEAGNVKLGQRAWALLVVTFWVISFDGRCDGRRAEFLLILHVLFFDYWTRFLASKCVSVMPAVFLRTIIRFSIRLPICGSATKCDAERWLRSLLVSCALAK